MNILLLFLVLFLALAGMGTVWYISSRNKCVVPSDSKGCPDGQAYYCPTPDGQSTCDTFDKVCGKWPSGFDYDHCGSIDCQYDADSKVNVWKCNGSPGGGGAGGKGTPCSIKDGSLDQRTLKGTSLENNYKPASNSASYSHDTYYKGCRLDTCEKGYDPYPAGTGAYLCVPHGIINVQNTACTSYNNYDYDTGPNNNFDWVNTYIDPKVYGDFPQLVCKESSCAGTIDKTKNPYTCTKSDPSICPGYPTEGPSNIASWENVSGVGCRIRTCVGQGEWVVPDDGDPDLTGTGTGSANTARCHPNCTMNVPPGSITTYDRSTNSCKVTGCTDGWKLNGDHCEPDCSTSENIINFLFKGTTPIDQQGFVYKARAIQDSNKNWICVPEQASQDNPFGGCGDATHTAYAADASDGTATFCQTTVNGNTAKYNIDATGTLGCLACQPRVCPSWATTLKQCIGDVENDCGYTEEAVVNDENVPVQTCVTEISKSSTINIWRTFDPYNEQAVYDDPAVYAGSATMRKTSGAPLKYTSWRLLFTGNSSNPDMHVDPYTSHLSGTIEIPNFSETNDTPLTFWAYRIIGYNSSKVTIKVSDIWKCIRDNYLTTDKTGDATVTIALQAGTYSAGFDTNMSVQSILVNKTPYTYPFKPPLDFQLS